MSPPLQSGLGFAMIARNRPQISRAIAPNPDRQGGDANGFPCDRPLVGCPRVTLAYWRRHTIVALTPTLSLNQAQRMELEGYLRKRNLRASVPQRMRIVLMLADGASFAK